MQSIEKPWNSGGTQPGLVILDPPRSGSDNMAIDEALIEKARPDWPIVLRVYQWERPTLSIGHFQRIEDRKNSPSLTDLPWVRRKTGGGAIVHDCELTYSIVVPNRGEKAMKGPNQTLYRAIHTRFVQELGAIGLNTQLSESCTCSTNTPQTSEPFLCFSRRSPVDLLIGQDKILGSAQRRTSTGILQHGSFLLRRTQSTPHLAGLLDHTSGAANQFDLAQWQNFFITTLKNGLSQLLQVQWQNGKLIDLPSPGGNEVSNLWFSELDD